MLDLTRYGSSTRYSPEDVNCPILVEGNIEMRAGGAANLAIWLAAIPGSEVTLYAHVTQARDGLALMDLLHARNVDLSSIGVRKPMEGVDTLKERIMINLEGAQPRQLVRIDRDTQMHLSTREEEQIEHAFSVRQFEAIVIADYDKGFFYGLPGMGLREYLGKHLEDAEQSVFVNSKFPDRWQEYPWHTLIANREEASRAWDDKQSPYHRMRPRNIVVTLGAEGVLLHHRAPPHELWTQIRQSSLVVDPVDVTGAGDAFTAGYVYGTLLARQQPMQAGDYRLQHALTHGSLWAAHCCRQVGVGYPNLEVMYG